MRTILAISLALALSGPACARRDEAAPAATPAAIATVSVGELDSMLARHACQAVDANSRVTRERMGVIPGAILLADVDSTAGLPADRSTALVFYCSNTACRASHEAAERAIAAGYRHLRVLPDGIAGWVQAGKPTASI